MKSQTSDTKGHAPGLLPMHQRANILSDLMITPFPCFSPHKLGFFGERLVRKCENKIKNMIRSIKRWLFLYVNDSSKKGPYCQNSDRDLRGRCDNGEGACGGQRGVNGGNVRTAGTSSGSLAQPLLVLFLWDGAAIVRFSRQPPLRATFLQEGPPDAEWPALLRHTLKGLFWT